MELDCLRILDEGGVLLATAPTACDAVNQLLDRGEQDGLRSLVDAGVVRPWLLGHAHLDLAKDHVAILIPLPRAKAVVIAIDADAPLSLVDEGLARCVSEPKFCSARDERRAVALQDLYIDLRPFDK